MSAKPPPLPLQRLALGITGHRDSNAAFSANRTAVRLAIETLFQRIETLTAEFGGLAPNRLHSLLACGVDLIGVEAAAALGWELVAPLPFGPALNCAINALPQGVADADALLAGAAASDPATRARADAIRGWCGRSHVFALADLDDQIGALHRAMLLAPGDLVAAQTFSAHASDQVALAGRVMVEQSDLLIAVWDGKVRNLAGGTGHTIGTALEFGAPVLLLNPAEPHRWRILRAAESLAAPDRLPCASDEDITELIRAALQADERPELDAAVAQLERARWRGHSSHRYTAYRRIEALFGGQGRPFRSLKVRYETPEEIASGSRAELLADAAELPGTDPAFVGGIADSILPRFAWTDGISAWFSDAYRSGMIANFVLSSLAIMAGLAYQPLGLERVKWVFSLMEFLLLVAILVITVIGGRRNWHARWFETRRVAEYLRHAPIMLLLGVARAPGRWPRGSDTNWPESHARHCLRAVGLPAVAVTQAYLRAALSTLIEPHVVSQRDYHRAKSARLETVHRRLDRLSETMFLCAVLSVSVYLGISLAAKLGTIDEAAPEHLSHLFTFIGVSLPMLGASVAGVRFFGDFERFAAISEVTAEKLDGVEARIGLLLAAHDHPIDYATVADLVHRIDEIVVDEIENWQAVFGGKHLALPA